MSRRRLELPEESELELELELELEDFPLEEDVEYLPVDVEDDSWRTSVPKSVQESQSSSSAPSTFVVVKDAWLAPHISH